MDWMRLREVYALKVVLQRVSISASVMTFSPARRGACLVIGIVTSS